MKDLIISLAVDGRDRYSEIVKGLEKSIVDANWQGDVEIYKSFPDWVIPHKIIPYAFKYQLILKKLNEGYKRCFWLDSTMRLVPGKNISVLLDRSDGIVVFDNIGHPLINYINDTAIKNLGLDRYDIGFSKGPPEVVKQIWGGSIFFDFNKIHVKDFLDVIINQMLIGSFNEDATNRKGFIQHRHDQALISGICHILGIPLLNYGVIAAPKDVTDKTYIRYGD